MEIVKIVLLVVLIISIIIVILSADRVIVKFENDYQIKKIQKIENNNFEILENIL